MRVEGKGPLGPVKAYRSQRAENMRSQGNSKADIDRLELSFEAQLRQVLTEKARETPEVREELVEGLQRKLATGSYLVDTEALARVLTAAVGKGGGVGHEPPVE